MLKSKGMGRMLFLARKRRGTGLIGLLIIAALLYYTGAGKWLWQRVQHFGGDCYAMASPLGSFATPVCNGVGRAIGAIDGATSRVGDQFSQFASQLMGGFGSPFHSLSGIGEALQQRLGAFGSSSGDLSRMMGEGPQGLTRFGSASEQFRQALDSFTIGQQYLDSGSGAQAIPWLRQGAAEPGGYGMMSQLSLGNLYASGSDDGVTASPVQALTYYVQARQSLTSLAASNTPQSQAILKSLPVSPQVLARQLDAAIASLTHKR